MIKLLLDQGIPYSTTHRLKEAGWEVDHVSEINMSRATDEEILAYARNNDYLCITLDADFHAILAIHNAARPSVIRIRQEGLDGKALAHLLERIWPRIDKFVRVGAMVTVTEERLRIHDLPVIKDQ